MEHTYQSTLYSNQLEIRTMVEKIEQWLHDLSIDPKYISNIQIALTEALNNVAEHAYKESNKGKIHLNLSYSSQSLSIQITDQGQKFKKLPKIELKTYDELDINELPEGGFGLYLIHSLADHVDFESTNTENNLFLKFNIL